MHLTRFQRQNMVVEWNLLNPQGQRVEPSLPENHEDHIAGKGFTSMAHCNMVHKFTPMPQAMKILDAKAAVDKEWKKLEAGPAWQLEKVKSTKEVSLEAQRDKKERPLCYIDGHLFPQKNAELEPKLQKYKGRVVLRGDICKRRLWCLCSLQPNRARLRPK